MCTVTKENLISAIAQDDGGGASGTSAVVEGCNLDYVLYNMTTIGYYFLNAMSQPHTQRNYIDRDWCDRRPGQHHQRP